MKYKVKGLWAGKYAHVRYGLTDSFITAFCWFVKYSIYEFIRVLKLNKHYTGNIFGRLAKKVKAVRS